MIADLALALAATAVAGSAANLYVPNSWVALAADRRAYQPGDIITILVYESASAQNSATSGSKRGSKLDGRVAAGPSFDKSLGFSLGGSSDNQGMTGRSGGMFAQISAAVEAVLPNGDLRVAGTQFLTLNGERTTIKVRGRVRPVDISAANTVISTRLAEAEINYDGNGFVSRSSKPGILSRIFNWLAVM